MMCEPRQRGAYKSHKCGHNLDKPKNAVIDYCAHCLNGGTVANVKKHLPPNGWNVFDPVKDFDGTSRRAGLCGDPKGRMDHMIGGDFMPYKHVPIVSHYKTGAEVDFVAELDTNHNGYFEYFLCNLDKCSASDISGECFKEKQCYRLLRVPHPDCQKPSRKTHYECGPIDPVYPGRWYLPCRKTGHVGVHIVGGTSGTMRYKLPEGVECNHCVIEWYWATANSCAPRGFKEYIKGFNFPFGKTCDSDGGGRGTYRDNMSKCGGKTVPEEFWSCADVQITKNGKSAGPVVAVSEAREDPDVRANDDEEVRNDPDGVGKKAAEELKEDIEMAANESSGERKREEVRAANGECVLEDEPCDGNIDCCDTQQVCVYTARAGGFSCRFWWSLWKDVEDREKAEKNM